MEIKKYKAEEKDAKKRLDLVVMDVLPDISRSAIKNMIHDEAILVNDKVVLPNYKVKVGEEITINPEKFRKDTDKNLSPTKMDLNILFEDEHTLVLDKPSGLDVHPVIKNKPNSILNGVIYYLINQSKFTENKRARLVHRLDTQTSGVLLVSKSLESQMFYSKQFEERKVKKTYLALVHGDFSEYAETITVSKSLIKDPSKKSDRMIESPAGKAAVTRINFEEFFKKENLSLLKCIPKTGRTHQIRAHLSGLGYPIVGDTMYGSSERSRLMLHAWKLRFVLYTTKKETTIESSIPKAFLISN